MRTVCQRVAIILIFLGCFSTIGHAKQDTYTNWVFDLEQALKKQDLTALSELVKKNPGYSKVWYYGYILDVVTPGVPSKEQTRIRRAGTVIAETLATLPEPQYDAMRMLERLSAPGVDDIAKAIRLGEEGVDRSCESARPLTLPTFCDSRCGHGSAGFLSFFISCGEMAGQAWRARSIGSICEGCPWSRNGLCPRETGPEAMENHPRFFRCRGLRYAQIAVG